jgi:hypothetical protein
MPKVLKIEIISILDVYLLLVVSRGAYIQKKTTYSEPIEEVFFWAVDVESPTHLFYLVECQLLISFDVGTLPVLFLPYPLSLSVLVSRPRTPESSLDLACRK